MIKIKRRSRSTWTGNQSGAATLVVVMILFFVAALAAAYASRNLIFEQRTSANQYRATQAFEAAEAGLEWTLAMLNSGRIDTNCKATTDTSENSFRQRYLSISGGTGIIQPRYALDASPPLSIAKFMWVACARINGEWTCQCPYTASPTLNPFVDASAAFGVRFQSASSANYPNLIRIEINGCSQYSDSCIKTVATTSPFIVDRCNSTLCSLAAQARSVKNIPIAAITAKGSVTGTDLSVSNTHIETGGVTVRSGLAISGLKLNTVGGKPPESSKHENDAGLIELSSDTPNCLFCLFSSVFGVSPETYSQQPAIQQIDCETPCDASDVSDAITSAGRGRMVWLSGSGGLTIATADAIGSATEPVVIITDGPLKIEASADTGPTTRARIYGLVYASSAELDGGRIDGALLTHGNVTGQSPAEVVYDPSILNTLRLLEGSYVRIQGSWRDFP